MNTKPRQKQRTFFGNYTSERQQAYYELAEKQGIDVSNRKALKEFIRKTNNQISDIVLKNTSNINGKKSVNYFEVVSEIRSKYNLAKYYSLDFLQKIVSYESNKQAFEELGIRYEDILKLPKNEILKNEEIENKKVPRIDDLIEAQTDNEFGFMAEWISNAIDASTPGESIGRFGEGFLQSLEKIDLPGSQIKLSTKKDGFKAYDLFIKKEDGNLKFGSILGEKQEKGTTVKIEKIFSKEEQRLIKEFVFKKFKTNTRSNIIFNDVLLNDLDGYKYMNGDDLDMSGVSTVELKLGDNGFEVIDHGSGMDEETIAKKLLRPNSTGNVRRELTDEEVLENAPKETKFFYRTKALSQSLPSRERGSSENIPPLTRGRLGGGSKTTISLNIAGVSIEDFEVETFGNIGDFTFEFPSSSPLKDSRNEIDLSREVAVSLGVALEKIDKKAKTFEEKLSLLEIVGAIYEKLKDRPSNIVDERFVLATVMKNNFQSIIEKLEKEGIKVLPANKNLVNTIGHLDNVFFVNEEFIDFNIDNIPNKKQIERVEAEKIKGSIVGEKYKFFEVSFAKTAEYDYLVYEGNIFINSDLFIGKTEEQKDKIRSILNTSINLNTTYEIESERNNYGRILTSGEEFVVEEESLKEKSYNEDNSKLTQSEKEIDNYFDRKSFEVEKEVLLELDNFRKRLGNKLAKNDLNGVKFIKNNLNTLITVIDLWKTKQEEGSFIKKKEVFINTHKINLLLGVQHFFTVNDFSKIEINNLLLILEDFVAKTPENIVKPFLDFIGWEYGILNTNQDIKGFIIFVETLVKAIKSDPKTIVELMERFEEGKTGYLIKDYLELEKKNEAKLKKNSKNKEETKETYNEKLTKNFINSSFLTFGDFIDEFIKARQSGYEEGIRLIELDFEKEFKKYEQDSEKMKQIEKKYEENRDFFIKQYFGSIFKNYSIKGKGIYPNFFENIAIDKNFYNCNDLQGYYKEVLSKLAFNYREEKIKSDFAKYKLDTKEFFEYVDGDFELIESKKDEYLKFRDKFEKNFYEKYLVEFDRDLKAALESLFILTENFMEVEESEEEAVEYRIDETDSIYDERFSFLLDILKGLDENGDYNELVWDDDNSGYDLNEEMYDNFSFYESKFDELFDYELNVESFKILNWFEGKDGKNYQREMFEILIKNPKYKHLFKKEIKKEDEQIDIFTELSKKYPQDLIIFLQFLKSGGEFLKNSDLKVEDFKADLKIKHSDLMGVIFASEDEVVTGNSLETIKQIHEKQTEAGFNNKDNQDIISGVIMAQDRVSMLYLREGVQNSVDAIKKHNSPPSNFPPKQGGRIAQKVEEKVSIDFYSNDNHFVSSFTDPVGMEIKDTTVKLLVPYNSGKVVGEGVGQFGKGFFTFGPDTKEIRIKTSIGNGKVVYAKLTPKKVDGIINDFDVEIDEKEEEFRGTIIERIDESTGINANLRAMIGTNLAKKYLGNIRGVDIEYNKTILNKEENLEVISSSENIIGKNKHGEITELGVLELMKNKDNISRFTKDDLWISEIKDDILSDFPDWIVNLIKEDNLTINIPSKIPLIGSRNSLKNRKYYIELLKPYLYKQVIDYTLKSYVARDKKIPMLPEDYLGLKSYDFRHTQNIEKLALRFNDNLKIDFSFDEIKLLKDRANMSEFLVLCNFEHDGKVTSLYNIKQKLLKNELDVREKMNFGNIFSSQVSKAQIDKESFNKNVEKFNLNFEEIKEETGLKDQQIKDFKRFIYKEFRDLINDHFGGYFEVSFYKKDGGVANNFSNVGNGMAFNVSNLGFKNYVLNFNKPCIKEELIEIITHEMTHNLEGDKWGTHETDENHDKSFMKIQRGILREMVRGCLVKK